MSRPTVAEIDLGAIRHNFLAIRALVNSRVRVLAILKADAYGHGAVEVARTFQAAGADMLGVALIEEGVQLRVGGITAPILVLGIPPADEIPAVMEYDLRVTVDDLATAREIERQAAERHRVVRVHLKIDTGMNRMGIRAEDAADAAGAIAGMKHIAVEGMYTHFACADSEEDISTPHQLDRFGAALAGFHARGILPPLVHAANSSALISHPSTHFDMVRSGLALYGIRPCPDAADVDLRPALALKSRVVHLKRVRRGEGVSYGYQWMAARDSLLGVLPLGYADGYPRALSNRGQVRVAGHVVPVRGAVCMDTTLVDLTDVPDAAVGMPATLLEPLHESPLSAEALARLCGTIPYEILVRLGARIPRVYI